MNRLRVKSRGRTRLACARGLPGRCAAKRLPSAAKRRRCAPKRPRAAGVAVLAALAGAPSCGTRIPPPPPLPEAGIAGERVRDEGRPFRAPPPEGPSVPAVAASTDAILGSPWAAHEDAEGHVARWLDHWRSRERGPFERALVRMGRYEDFIEAEIGKRELPPSLKYLPVIEGGYYPKALSRVGAGGIWQFMPETARWLGLQVTPLVDERFDPYRATPAALGYLEQLHRQFHSWFLALAAYNSGPGRLERLLREHAPGQARSDGLFWRVRPKLPAETRDFIPKFLAAVRVAEDPAAHGFAPGARDAPLALDAAAVRGAASVDVLARAAGVSEDTVKFLNPHLLRGLAPAGTTTVVRLPAGSGAVFADRFASIPSDERVTFREHAVAPGETLWSISRRYDVAVDEIRAANPSVEPTRMQVGTVLVVPRAGRAPGAASAAQANPGVPSARDASKPVLSSPSNEPGVRVHVVAPGESLWLIARLHGVPVDRLRRYNGLESDLIRAGAKLRIPPAAGSEGAGTRPSRSPRRSGSTRRLRFSV